MSNERETTEFGEESSDNNRDPLGILGWEIGGKYKIRAYIGGGGFGEVYEGFNKNLPDQRLVFKFFKRVQSRDKFAKEAKILCLLDHPNISRVIDFLPDEGAVVVAFIDGKDGGEILQESGPLSEELFLKTARAMTSAIAYAHGKKIAHRDIKPSNIMFDKNDNIYLIDFGIAKEMGGVATKTAHQALTPLFAAPERQTGGSGYNPFLSDIYEIGVALFNFSTNSLPYRNPANPDLQEWGGPASNRLSSELRQILKKATHPNPDKRYKKAADMAEDFKNLRQVYGEGGQRKRSWMIYAAAAVIIAAALLLSRNQIMNLISSANGLDRDEVTEEELSTGDKTIADTMNMEEQAISEDIIPKKEVGAVEEKPKEIPTETEVVTGHSETQETPVESTEQDIGPETETAAEKTEPEPISAPVRYPLRTQIRPDGRAFISVDGVMAGADTTFNVLPGSHEVLIIHQDFPVLSRSIMVSDEPVTVNTDLDREFVSADSVSLQISLSPPSDEHMIELAFNGRRYSLMNFPVLDLIKLKGRWRIGASIFPMNQDLLPARIDSLVIYPYGGGVRNVIIGLTGDINLGSPNGRKMESIPLLIYWSEEK